MFLRLIFVFFFFSFCSHFVCMYVLLKPVFSFSRHVFASGKGSTHARGGHLSLLYCLPPLSLLHLSAMLWLCLNLYPRHVSCLKKLHSSNNLQQQTNNICYLAVQYLDNDWLSFGSWAASKDSSLWVTSEKSDSLEDTSYINLIARQCQ